MESRSGMRRLFWSIRLRTQREERNEQNALACNDSVGQDEGSEGGIRKGENWGPERKSQSGNGESERGQQSREEGR